MRTPPPSLPSYALCSLVSLALAAARTLGRASPSSVKVFVGSSTISLTVSIRVPAMVVTKNTLIIWSPPHAPPPPPPPPSSSPPPSQEQQHNYNTKCKKEEGEQHQETASEMHGRADETMGAWQRRKRRRVTMLHTAGATMKKTGRKGDRCCH